ncbi:cytosolic carboxypeptidase 1-like isoform X3 [Aphidius gifuensis]|uniref:cytosolic carboxypeptidase 1-like isoform X3 n=1 Tax=Aphidius gifuensis TaxID=684658 RepID=UPI001CDC6BE6|nr:cytosolic carboxypeptidase 1-like isoform X3 [Aphidius gifuensis]
MKSTRDSDKENYIKHQLNSNFLNTEIAMSTTNKNMDDPINEVLLEKLKSCLPKIQDNSELIRSILAKLHARVTSSDKKIRERVLDILWLKDSGAIELFIMILETCRDNASNCSIAGILHECISPRLLKIGTKGTKKKNSKKSSSRLTIQQIINTGGTQILLKLLLNSQHTDTITSEILVQELLWILGQIAQKDQKFSIKIKYLNGIKVFHTLLKQHYTDSRMILPLLLIFRSLAKNSYTVQTLSKDGIASILEKTFVTIGYTPHLKLKILLECFKNFTSNRLCCAKFVKVGMVHSLTRIFERWDKYDNSIRLKIANYSLCTLHHLCSIKSGRRAVKANNGLQLLYRFCVNCPEEKSYDYLISKVCGIINLCLEKKELPVLELSPAKFIIPNGNNINKRENSIDSCSDADSQANSINCDSDSGEDDDDDDEEDEEDEDDEDDDDLNSSDDNKKLQLTSDVEERQLLAGVSRTTDDLLMYNIFFKELYDINIHKKINDEKSISLNNGIKLKIFDNIYDNCDDKTAYCNIASNVNSVLPFVKVAYPDLAGCDCRGLSEPLNNKDRKVCRAKLMLNIDRSLRPCSITQDVIYDLDALTTATTTTSESKLLKNIDESRIGCRFVDTKCLQFESRFESGNLRKVIQINNREYDLILTPDVNSASRHQWFYFEVSNMDSNIPYTFNIINCEKPNSQFNFGMKPIIFSVIESQLGKIGWTRTGTDICYYRNCYRKKNKGKNYLTTSFTITFPHSHDICYLAYHFPYTYSQLIRHIWKWSKTTTKSNDIYFKYDNLCNTLNKNECPILTITSINSKTNPINQRKLIFLTSRVHPGESNASWVMQGTLETLLGDTIYAKSLRDDYVFKIVPMLNIEGVINGCNRYGLTNEDLNRRWSNPNRLIHPVIFNTKGLIEYCTSVLNNPPFIFVDYHGHSRRKNVFLFGCSKSASWSSVDRAKNDQPVQYLMLPRLMQKTSAAFSFPLCSFKVENRSRESTARVAIWRLGVARSYTMESSFCGCDQGSLAGLHFDTIHLKNVGRDLMLAIGLMKESNDQWTYDKSTVKSCCPMNCIMRKCKLPKCLQDKHAGQHIIGENTHD